MKCAHGDTLVLEVPILVNYWNYLSNKLKGMDASLVLKQDKNICFPSLHNAYSIL
jgi:hypothetical protein